MSNDRFVERHPAELLSQRDWVLQLARSLVRDPGRAEDVTQGALLAAWAQPPGRIQDLRAWLGQVVRRQVGLGFRREQRRLDHEALAARKDWQAEGDLLTERADCHRRLVEHVLALPRAYSLVLLQRYFEGLGPAAIARGEGCSVATISSRLTRAHAALRVRLDEDGGGGEWLAGLVLLTRPSATSGAVLGSGLMALTASSKVLVSAAAVVLALGLALLRSLGSGPPPSAVLGPPSVAELEERGESAGESGPAGSSPVAAVRLRQGLSAPAEVEPEEEEMEAISLDSVLDSTFLEEADEPAVGPLACVVHGKALTPKGKPAPGEQIVIARAGRSPQSFSNQLDRGQVLVRAVTEADGSFVFPAIDPGDYLIGSMGRRSIQWLDGSGASHVRDRQGLGAPILEPLSIEPGPAELEHRITIWDGLAISGRVTYPDGEPAQDVHFMGLREGTSGSLGTGTGEDGRFRLGPLPPGTYTLLGSHSPEGWSLSGQVDVEAGTSDLRFVLERAASLKGQLLGSDVPEALVGRLSFRQELGSPWPGRGRVIRLGTDDAGAFAQTGLDPATYTLQYSSEDKQWFGVARGVKLDSGELQEELLIPVSPAAPLTLLNPSESGPLVAYLATTDGPYAQLTLPADYPRTIAVPPGLIYLRFEDRAQGTEEKLEVMAVSGKAQQVEARMP